MLMWFPINLHRFLRWPIFLSLWAGGITVIALDIGGFAPNPTATHYSPIFLLATGTLWLFYFAIQYLIRRQVEFVLPSISVVMFVQSFATLVALLGRLDVMDQLSEAPPPPLSALLILSVGTSIILGLVVLQTMTLSGARTFIRATVDAYTERWGDNLGQAGLTRMHAVKELAPLDLGGPEILRKINGFPRMRNLIRQLVLQDVPPEEMETFLNEISGVRRDRVGIITGEILGERLRGAGHISWYLGMSASVIGSWVIVFGSLFI